MSVLHSPTMVLNKGWHPIDSIIVRDALCDVMSNRAVFIEATDYSQHDMASWMCLPVPEGQPAIITSRGKIRVPELILSEYKYVPVRKVVFCRRNLWHRDQRRCQYCGTEPKPDEITIDHIIPKSKGGKSTFDNCVLCCVKCNLKKGNRTLKDSGMRLRKQKLVNGIWTSVFYDTPKRPTWNPLYTLRRKSCPKSWAAFLKHFDESLYWEVTLES